MPKQVPVPYMGPHLVHGYHGLRHALHGRLQNAVYDGNLIGVLDTGTDAGEEGKACKSTHVEKHR